MKRIVLSLSTVLMVGALAVGATGAFFSDTETSANNIFTAGSIDLKIDHSLSTYNGAGNSLVIVSDPQTQVDAHAAAIITDTPITTQYWTASSSPLLAGSAWIWSENPAANDAINNNVQKTFTRTFNWNGPVTSATLAIAADNRYQIVSLNSCTNVDAGAGMASNDQHVAADSYNVTGCIVSGVNTLVVLGQNDAQASPPDQAQNPAGVRFRLEIQGQDTTFSDPIDLNGQTFWNFNDVKPADNGRDDFSLHVDTNDAWTCMLVGNVKNDENDLIEPEATAGDTTPGPLGNGELGQYLSLFLWHDINHDGIYQPGTESPLGGGGGIFTNLFTGAGTSSIPIHDSVSDGVPQPGGSTDYVGSAWCAGTLSVDGGGNVTCDGSSVSNTAQTDSTKADLTFYATQSRNQPSFTCSSLGGGGGCTVNPDADLITDGGFENPVVANAALWDIFPSPAGAWSIDWRSDVPATFGPQTRPAPANLELHRGVLGNAFAGEQYAELDSDWGGPSDGNTGEPASVTIHQTIATTPGTTYTLHFAFAPRPSTTADENNLEVRWGGSVVSTVPPTSGAGGPIAWQTFDVPVTATTTSTTLSFTDLGTADSLGTFLDDVELHASSCVNPVS